VRVCVRARMCVFASIEAELCKIYADVANKSTLPLPDNTSVKRTAVPKFSMASAMCQNFFTQIFNTSVAQ
jgi:hypothetical protein